MEDSQPLRRSTRNSVVTKNEELTPRKRKVSTPVKVEPSTPSRRTRASTATPKKNLIEVLNTPKKTLPVLNEEESSSTRTPAKKTKEVSPKTPSRRRIVRESMSTPKSTKKSVDTSEEINVAANRPLTRAKRKTMGEIQAAEVVKTEPEKVVQNKKDKPESDKVTQSKKGKSTSSKTGDKTINSPTSGSKSEKNKDESSCAFVPRVLVKDIKKQLSKETKNTENEVEENECGVFKTLSPVKAEDVAINSPRKVPENCKSSSEASLKSGSEYIRSRSRRITMDSENSTSSVGNTDISSVEQATSESSIDSKSAVTSSEKVTDSKDNVSSIVTTSPQKVIDSKDDIQNIVTTPPLEEGDNKANKTPSPPLLKSPESKDVKIPNIVVMCPSPYKVLDSKNIDVPNIVVTCPSPNKVPDSKDIDVPNIVVTCPSPNKVSDSKDINVPNIVITSPSPRKVIDSKDTTLKKNPSSVVADVENKDIDQPSNAEAVTSINTDIEMTDAPDETKSIKLEKEPSSTEKNNEKSANEEMDENSKTIISADLNEVSPTKTDILNKENKEFRLISPSSGNPGVDENNSVQVVMQASAADNVDTNDEVIKIENKASGELNKSFEKVESNEQIPGSAECIVTSEVYVEKSEKVIEDSNRVSELTDANEAITKDVPPIENEHGKEAEESKLNITADNSLKLNTSCLNESSVENKTVETEVVQEPAMDEESSVEKEESEKQDELPTEEASSSSPSDEATSNEHVSAECEKESEIHPEVDTIKKNSENLEESSPVKPYNDSSPEKSDSDKNKSVTENMNIEGLEVAGPPCHVESCDDSSSPLFYMRCDCETSDDSGDSGIHNEDSVIIFKMASQCKKHIIVKERNVASISPPADEGTIKDDSKPEGSARKSLDFIEALSEEHENNCGESGGSASDLILSTGKASVRTSPEKSYVKTSPEKSDIKTSPLISEVKISPAKSDVNISPAKSDVNISPEKSDINISPEKSDVKTCEKSNVNYSLGYVKVDSNISSPMKDKKEKIVESGPKTLESTEDCASKFTGLDEILMSPKDFLNSDEQSNADSEKTADSQSENETDPCCKNKTSEESAKMKGRTKSIKVNEKPDNGDGNGVSSKSAVDEAEAIVNTSTISDSKNETIPVDTEVTIGDEDNCIEPEKVEIKTSKGSKDSLSNSLADNKICENKLKSLNVDDISEKINSGNSIDKNESELSKTEINVQGYRSKTISSPEIDVEKFSDDGKSSNESGSKLEVSVKEINSSDEEDGIDTKTDHDYVRNNTKFIKNKRKNVNKELVYETDSSESEDDSELNNGPPSNVATEGSTDGPISGKDFIDFEAEEGEETSEYDSFIVVEDSKLSNSRSDGLMFGKDFIDFEAMEGEETSEDEFFVVSSSGDSCSSDSPRFTMKLRKRKRNLDAESSDSCSYSDSVQRLFDSSSDLLNGNSDQDITIKNKKKKLEKVSKLNKKNKRPKSILKNKHRVVKSEENRNKIETGRKVIKEFSKIGVFTISSINQNLEDPKLSCNISKKSSKLRREQKKSDTLDDYAAPRGFVVSYGDSCLLAKKRRKADVSSDLVNMKKKIREGKTIKKTVKKSISESNRDNSKNKTVSPYVVTLLLPIPMSCQSVFSVLTGLEAYDISSINFPKSKVAVVEFTNKESFEKILKLYGELKINNKPIYILEGCSV